MQQVGDNVSFSITPVPFTGTQIYAYAWKWWDSTSEATKVPWAAKRLNIGGQPGTGELHYQAQPVQIDGQSVTLNGTITANNPPTILPPALVSANDQYFPYNTQISVTAFDFDNDSLSFAWYSNSNFLGAGVSSMIGNVSGTWRGNGTSIIQEYVGVKNSLSATIVSARDISVYVVDSRAGTTALNFELRGSPKPSPVVGVSALPTGVTTDASSIPLERIGIGRTVDFEVYARDVTGGAIGFQWSFSGSNNWTTGPTYTTGVVTATPDGGFKSTYSKDISGEVISSGTEKTAVAVVQITDGANFQNLPFAVRLVKNLPPGPITITVRVDNSSYNQANLPPITAGSSVEFDAVAGDPNNDLVDYYWVFIQPSGVLPPTLRLWGAKAVIDSTGYSGNFVQAQVTATDRFGSSVTAGTPAIPVT